MATPAPATETVLVLGASGNIGISAIFGAKATGRNVIAVVRSKESQDKVVKAVGSADGITFTIGDATDEKACHAVVEDVKAGKLPAFHHVFSAMGGVFSFKDIHLTDLASFYEVFKVNFEANYNAYHATIPYLLEQGNPNSTWTTISGAIAEMGIGGAGTIASGALGAMSAAAAFETWQTNVRFNEIYLSMGVFSDATEDTTYKVSSKYFGKVFEKILADKELKSKRIRVDTISDVETLNVTDKLPPGPLTEHFKKNGSDMSIFS